jgi:hypothetical protein
MKFSTPTFSTIRLVADNDRNGNPRRVFVVFHNGDVVAAYDEGYAGTGAITALDHRRAYQGIDIDVPVYEYERYATFKEKQS